jgi:GTP-binding protein
MDHRAFKFVDRVRIQVIGGRGGKGIVSFENVMVGWKKRPIGGTGGRGGDLIIEASATVRDLSMQSYVIRGRPGGDATGKGNNGRAGRDKRLVVPVGTLVKELRRTYVLDEEEAEGEREDVEGGEEESIQTMRGRGRRRVSRASSATEGEEEGAVPSSSPSLIVADKLRSVRSAGLDPATVRAQNSGPAPMRVNKAGLAFRESLEVLVDLSAPGQSFRVARGGGAGVGNRGSLLTYAEQRDEHDKPHVGGGAGEMRFLELELKSIADAGLVGFPNAGKSSLLGAVSRVSAYVACACALSAPVRAHRD